MTWILVGGAIFCGWAMLRTMGAERERCALEKRLAAAPPPAPPTDAAAAPAQKPSTTFKPPRRPRQAA